MWQSQVVTGWRHEGWLQGLKEGLLQGFKEGWLQGFKEGLQQERRESLLRVLNKRFPPEVPQDVIQVVNQTTDLDHLNSWFDAALTIPSLEAFRPLIQGATFLSLLGHGKSPS